jgi:hypothetical protein
MTFLGGVPSPPTASTVSATRWTRRKVLEWTFLAMLPAAQCKYLDLLQWLRADIIDAEWEASSICAIVQGYNIKLCQVAVEGGQLAVLQCVTASERLPLGYRHNGSGGWGRAP